MSGGCSRWIRLSTRVAEHKWVSVEITEHVATITFTRPPVNATDRESFLEIGAAFRRVSEDPDVRSVIFCSGARHFMAGADMRSRSTQDWTKEDLLTLGATSVTDTGRIARDSLWSVFECSVPVIAAVHGAAVGSGLAYASLCDFIVAADDARFGMTEINVGKLGGASHLLRAFGPYRARRMFFLGELVSVAELQDTGAFYKVVPRATLMAEALALAAVLVAKSPVALRLAKESLLRVEGLPVQDGYRIEQDYTRRLARFNDSGEAARSYLEKRSPVWEW
jgi:enoyl-CoA hydratase